MSSRGWMQSMVICAALLALTGCEFEPTNVTVETTPVAEGATPPTVDLPPAPSAQDFIIPETNSDGTLRVRGVIEYKTKHLDKEVVLKGTIVSVSPLCDPAKAKKSGEKCPEPHMIIRDPEEDAEKQLLVIGYDADFIKRAKVEEGQTHEFKGTYQMMGRGFTASEDGLLLLAAVGEEPVAEE